MPSSDLLTKQKSDIKKRIQDLKPLHEEYLRLLDADKVLGGIGNKAVAPKIKVRRGPGRPAKKRAPGRPRKTAAAKTAKPAKKRPGRPAKKRGPGRPRKVKAAAATKKRGPGRPRKAAAKTKAKAAAKATTGKRGPGRPKGSGGKTRAAQALAAIKDKPGITVPEIAKIVGVRQNYLYRVMTEMNKKGEVRKRKRGFYPVLAK